MIFINDFSLRFENDLRSLCKNSPYGTRIISYYTAYYGKKYDFLDFWIQRDNLNTAVCAICMYYSTVIICGEAHDISELSEFVSIISPLKIMCNGSLNLNFEMNLSFGETMACDKLNEFECGINNNFKISEVGSNMYILKAVYSLLLNENSKNNSLPDFESFFLDISHRIRHGTAKVYAVNDEVNGIVSTASVTAISDSSSVIGCVATQRDYRNIGLATFLVKYITEKELAQDRVVYLHREKDITLYEKIGFRTIGCWSEYTARAMSSYF